MKATNLNKVGSSGHNPTEWEEIPEIKAAYPRGNGYVEISLQKLNLPTKAILVQWMGAKNGLWYPDGDIFLITKK